MLPRVHADDDSSVYKVDTRVDYVRFPCVSINVKGGRGKTSYSIFTATSRTRVFYTELPALITPPPSLSRARSLSRSLALWSVFVLQLRRNCILLRNESSQDAGTGRRGSASERTIGETEMGNGSGI